MKLLTQAEVAERLRCSEDKVKRLRLAGKLRYLPGRPVLIDEADLESYLEVAKSAVQVENASATAKRRRDPTEEAAVRARRVWLARHLRSRISTL